MRPLFRLLTALALAVAAPAGAAFAQASGPVPLWEQPRYAAIVVDANSGEVLYQQRADMPRHPASITKVMTLMLAFDALDRGELRLDDTVEMTPEAVRQPPSKLGLKLGEGLPVEDAIRVIAVKSANDVAVALAQRLAGSEAAFVQQMNAKARALGMSGTNFANASGLPNVNHFTTARDLAVLAAALFREHADRYAYFSQQEFAWRGRLMPNHNKLLGRVPGVDGIKTGYTSASGYTLLSSAVRNGQRLITVVLGTPSGFVRDNNVAELIEAAYAVLESRRWGGRLDMQTALGLEQGYQPFAPDPIGDLIEQGSGSKTPLVVSRP